MGLVFTSVLIVCAIIYLRILWAAVPLTAIMSLACAGPIPKKERYKVFPTRVAIDQGEIESEGYNWYHVRKIEEVDKVYDYGDWYFITFSFPKNRQFICQKDLIVEGTIEEFEALFADKLCKKGEGGATHDS